LHQSWHQNIPNSSAETPGRSVASTRSLGRMLRRKQSIPVWMFVGAALLIALVWNWQLVVVTITGGMVMLVAYAAQGWQWDRLFLGLQRFLHSPNRRLIVAAGAGTLATLMLSMILAIWHGAENHWVASASILQFLATLSALFFLAKQAVDRWTQKQQIGIDYLVSKLGATDDLERLVSVRQLAQCVQQNRFPFNQERAIAEYCQVLLNREVVPAIRDAALETLEALNYISIASSSQHK
jgi:hypothetical protein